MTAASYGRERAAAACGLAAAALALLVPLLGGLADPAYSQVSQFISELGAAGAADASLVGAAGFAPIGVMVLAFLALARPALPRTRQVTIALSGLAAVGVAYLIAALFPCDAGCPGEGSTSQGVHNLFGVFEYTGASAGLVLLAAALRRAPRWRDLSPVSGLAAACVLIGFLAMLMPALAPLRGLAQRLAEGAIFGWIAAVSLTLLRGDAAAAARASGRMAA
jgi:hypothetical protein